MSFTEKILPGNYWITKSMEFVKVKSSGTLWYLKKWIVFYYYVFLKDELFDSDYENIKNIFDDFINSLPDEIKESATNFFYEIDIRSNSFIKLSSFLLTSNSFSTHEEKKVYIIKAKRFYFMYLMNSGGQSGWKEKIKNKFVLGVKYSNLVKEISDEMALAGLSQGKIDGQLSDFPASIRNERQIFFYYGFFHGKDSADLTGFYNLTNIGKAIIGSNYHELLLIWEHQKLKMLSQSPITDIQNIIPNSEINIQNFDILNHPYCKLLEIIIEKGEISTDEYQYIISKITNSNNINVNEINAQLLNLSKDRAGIFSRSAELTSEDFLKELKKFILGICDLNKDEGLNYLSFISWVKENKITLLNRNKGQFILDNYKKIVNYFDNKYLGDYLKFSEKLKEKYIKITNNQSFTLDDETKYDWHKYIINFDKNAYINQIYLAISSIENTYDYTISNPKLYGYYDNYKYIFKLFGINKNDFKNLIVDIQSQLSTGYILSIEGNEDYERLINPRELEQAVSEENLLNMSISDSYQNVINTNISRKRNMGLISAMRTYYHRNFKNTSSNLVKCDCCNEYTFLTENQYAYLEFHHLIPFSTDYGPDHYLNLFGICPNCHRKLHFLNSGEKPDLYINLSQNNNFHKTLIERINFLFEKKILEPIHIDFLKKEKILTPEQYNKLSNNLTI